MNELFPATLLPWVAGAAVITFFVGGIPFGLLISLAQGVDVRKTGSGNIGTTNVARSVGKAASALTLLLDAGKGALCVVLTRTFLPGLAGVDPAAIEPSGSLGWVLSFIYLMSIVGHVFSPFLGFHGGKGIAVGFGGALGLYWPLALAILAVFVVVVIPTRYVSLASICAGISLPIYGWIMKFSLPGIVPLICAAVLVVWAHRENIGRLMRHEEKRFSFHKDKA